MKTVPAEIINGINNSWEKGFLIKVCGKNESFWWSTRNIFIMMNDTEIPADYDRIATQIDGKKITPLSNVRSGVDISFGGGYNYISNFSITLLNQDKFSESLIEENLEGCMVIIHMFYINPEEEIVQLSDAMIIGIGAVDKITVHDYTKIVVNCTSSEYFRHKIIPDTKISENNFPYTPETSIGKVIPILYGSFIGTDPRIGNYNLAPAICIDENSREYAFAKHECKSTSVQTYIPIQKHKMYSEIISNTSYTNSSTIASVKLTESLKCELLFQSKLKGTQMNSYYSTTFKNAVDDDNSTQVLIQSGHNFYLKFEDIGTIGFPEIYDINDSIGYLRLYFDLGGVTNGSSGKAAKVKFYFNSNFVYINNYDILANMENSEVSFLFYFPVNLFYDILSKIEVGLTTETGGTVELKNVYTMFKFQI
jgi:hypothetical protein